jgi:hypothetical protein
MMKVQDQIEIGEGLDDLSRVWIYQSNREFTATEAESINQQAASFIEDWKAHGTKLKAAHSLLFNRFLCLFADETAAGASGCSIDASVRFIKTLENQFQVDFMDRNEVALLMSDQKVITKKLAELKDAISSGEINSGTLVFNNLVQTKGEMNSSWLLPIESSWHSRFLD